MASMDSTVFDGVNGLNGAWAVTVSPDGRHAYVAAGENDAVSWFTRDVGLGGEKVFFLSSKFSNFQSALTFSPRFLNVLGSYES